MSADPEREGQDAYILAERSGPGYCTNNTPCCAGDAEQEPCTPECHCYPQPGQLTFDDGTPVYCEWTADGPDKSLRFACMAPATFEGPDDDWYCAKHAPREAANKCDDCCAVAGCETCGPCVEHDS